MIRSIALAAGLGALVAAGALYAAAEPGWRGMIAVWLGASERAPEAKLATEDWPICTTMGSMGSEADWAQLDPDFHPRYVALHRHWWGPLHAAIERHQPDYIVPEIEAIRTEILADYETKGFTVVPSARATQEWPGPRPTP